MRFMHLTLPVALALSFFSEAHATRNVSSPQVEKGVFRYEGRFGLEFDGRQKVDHRLGQTHFIEYDFTDWYAMRLAGRWAKPEAEDNDFTFLNWEHRLQFFKEKRDGFDGGIKLVYSHADNRGAADALELQFLGQKKFGKWRNRTNVIFEHEVGENAEDGLVVDLSSQAMYAVNEDLMAGIEWFGDLGLLKDQSGIDDQTHLMGPIINYKVVPAVSIDTGYLVGLTDPASDGLLKFFIKAKF